jgi:hypothetical protein
MTSGQKSFPVAPSIFSFAQHGQSGMWFSELMPAMAQHADRWCMIRSMVTEAINHDPAITFFQTGSQLAGRPSIGAWVSYGLGSENADLPAYIVLTSFGSGRKDDQPLYDRLWGAGFLPTRHQGVKFRNSGDPVLYLADPSGIDRDTRRATLDRIATLNAARSSVIGDPEIAARTAQYEMAFRMQASVPELTDITKEPAHIYKLYGEEAKKPGSFANSVLMARRLVERGVRFVQIYHNNWDHHSNVGGRMPSQCKDVDQPCHALIQDLKQRGMFDDTLIIWGGEFGRTPSVELNESGQSKLGRDHNHYGFSVWLAGGGIRGGTIHGATDDFGFRATKDSTSVHDLHATILHLLGFNHEQLTYRHAGRDFRLTDVSGDVIHPILI